MHPLKSLAKKLVMNKTPMDKSAPVEASAVYTVKGNFQKYLLDEKGRLLEVFEPSVDPMSPKIIDFIK